VGSIWPSNRRGSVPVSCQSALRVGHPRRLNPGLCHRKLYVRALRASDLPCTSSCCKVREYPELKRFYRRKLIQKGMGKARIAAARKLGIRLWIMMRDQIDYQEFCRRGKLRQSGKAGMPDFNSGPALVGQRAGGMLLNEVSITWNSISVLSRAIEK
jgi:hypothetical protein